MRVEDTRKANELKFRKWLALFTTEETHGCFPLVEQQKEEEAAQQNKGGQK